jgi:hypothetical protein
MICDLTLMVRGVSVLYVDSCIGKMKVYEWLERFRKGRTSVDGGV